MLPHDDCLPNLHLGPRGQNRSKIAADVSRWLFLGFAKIGRVCIMQINFISQYMQSVGFGLERGNVVGKL